MAGIVDLNDLLKNMKPVIQRGEYVFCTVAGIYSDYEDLRPIACFAEPEGLTLILSVEDAEKANLVYENTYRQITLTVNSSLEAVGLTAAAATKLASHGISANVVAAYYHDHIFVPEEKADQALSALQELSVSV